MGQGLGGGEESGIVIVASALSQAVASNNGQGIRHREMYSLLPLHISGWYKARLVYGRVKSNVIFHRGLVANSYPS